MAIEDKMREALTQSDAKGPDNPDFRRLRDFYEEKKREGVVKRQEYNLPPLDTIGRIFYTRCRDTDKDKT